MQKKEKQKGDYMPLSVITEDSVYKGRAEQSLISLSFLCIECYIHLAALRLIYMAKKKARKEKSTP